LYLVVEIKGTEKSPAHFLGAFLRGMFCQPRRLAQKMRTKLFMTTGPGPDKRAQKCAGDFWFVIILSGAKKMFSEF
jgi:hypothetical protein